MQREVMWVTTRSTVLTASHISWCVCVHSEEGYIPSNYVTEKKSGNLVQFV